MKGSICVILLALIAAVATNIIEKPHYNLKDAEALFKKFIRDYDRHYKSNEDRAVHYQAFRDSLIEINLRNELTRAVFDINEYADWTPEELEMLNGFGHKDHRMPDSI